MGRKILFGLAILVVVVGGIVWFVFNATSGLADLRSGKVAEAHAMTSSQFKQATTVDQLGAFAKQFGLDKYKDATYSSRGIENGTGYLEGNLELSDGSKLPIRVEFIEESDVWKIQLVTPKSGIGSTERSSERAQVPGDEESMQLVKVSMGILADAIAARDFTNFYAYISDTWKAQTTKEDLLKAFSEFIEKEIDLRATSEAEMKLSAKPQIDLQNALNIDAEWATKPVRTVGNFRYVKEGPEWKMIGVSVNTKE
jgi:hypothetical protein